MQCPAFIRKSVQNAREEFLRPVFLFPQQGSQIRKALFRLHPVIQFLIHHQQSGEPFRCHPRLEVSIVHRLEEAVAFFPVERHDLPHQLIGDLFKSDPQEPAFRRDLTG